MTTSYPPGLLRRFAALLYDAILLAAMLFVATAMLLPFRSGQAFASGDPLYTVYLLTVSFALFGWCWTHGGQTLGMRAWRVRLEPEQEGNHITWGAALIRFLAALVSFGAMGLGFWWSLWDPQKRCWHDRVSRTRLRWEAPPTSPT